MIPEIQMSPPLIVPPHCLQSVCRLLNKRGNPSWNTWLRARDAKVARVLSIEESSERKELHSGRNPETCKGSPISVPLSTGQEITGAGERAN